MFRAWKRAGIEDVRLHDLRTRSRLARTGRNPRTGEAVSISGVDIADMQGREDAEGCRQYRFRIVTLQLHLNATGDDSYRLHVECSRMLCDGGYSASFRGGVEKAQDGRGADGWTATGLGAESRGK